MNDHYVEEDDSGAWNILKEGDKGFLTTCMNEQTARQVCEALNQVGESSPGVENIMVLSTAHITANDNTILSHWSRHEDGPVCVLEDEYRYMVPVTTDTDDAVDSALQELMSGAFIQLLSHAREHDFSYLCLDRDADVVDSFPTFEW